MPSTNERPNGGGKIALTTRSVNQWLASVLADPQRSIELARDPRGLLLSKFTTTRKQREHIIAIPTIQLEKIKDAIEIAARHKGRVFIERKAENAPGRLVIDYSAPSSHADVSSALGLSIGIAHCTFDADCENWECGWGP